MIWTSSANIIPEYFRTYPPTCLPAYLPTYLPIHPPTTYLPTHTYPPIYLPTNPLTELLTHLLPLNRYILLLTYRVPINFQARVRFPAWSTCSALREASSSSARRCWHRGGSRRWRCRTSHMTTCRRRSSSTWSTLRWVRNKRMWWVFFYFKGYFFQLNANNSLNYRSRRK